MTIIGHHRSADLAERHRRALEQEYNAPVEITSRRNAAGRYSSRGNTFTFEVTEPEDDFVEFDGFDSAYEET